jgi:hypothetical protein
VNVNTAIGQHARFSVDPADPGVGRNNSFQTLSSDSGRHSFRISLYNVNLAVAADVPAFHPSDEDLSMGSPAFHPSDEDLSMRIPVSKTGPAPENAVKMFIT